MFHDDIDVQWILYTRIYFYKTKEIETTKRRKEIQTRLSSCRLTGDCFKLGRGAGLGIFEVKMFCFGL